MNTCTWTRCRIRGDCSDGSDKENDILLIFAQYYLSAGARNSIPPIQSDEREETEGRNRMPNAFVKQGV